MRPPDAPWRAAAPWRRAYPVGVPPTYPYPDVPVVRLLDDAATDFPDVVAIEYRRYRMTYRKLADHVDRLATALDGAGVSQDDVVALRLPNCPQLVITLFAAWRLGASVRLLDRRAGIDVQPDEALLVTLDRWAGTDARGDAPATPLVTTARHDYLPFPANVLQPVRRALRRARRTTLRPSATAGRFADMIRRTPPAPEERSGAGVGPALTVDDARLAQRQLVVNSFQLRLWLPDVVAGDERVLLAIPLATSLGALWIVTAVLSAATMVLVDERRSGPRSRAAVRGRPTIMPFDGDLARTLLAGAGRRARMPTVRIAVAAVEVTSELRGRLETLTDKGRIRRVWGDGAVLTHADPIYGRADPATVGLPLPDTDAVVVDADRPEVVRPVGSRGRLWVRGPQLPAADWCDTGLEATVGADGYLTVYQ